MPVFHTKTIENILEPVAQQVIKVSGLNIMITNIFYLYGLHSCLYLTFVMTNLNTAPLLAIKNVFNIGNVIKINRFSTEQI